HLLSWIVVDFVTPDGYLSADSKEVMRRPIDLRGKRSWLNQTPNNPFNIYFSEPDVGVITRDHIIPIGLGIKSDDSGFIGNVSSGISIEKLISGLNQVMSEEFVFILFDDDMNWIAASDPFIKNEGLNKIALANVMEDSIKASKSNDMTFIHSDINIRLDGWKFPYAIHSPKFPFWFLVGFNVEDYYSHLWQDLAPKFFLSLVFCIVFAAILLYLSYQVVGPIIILGKEAAKISHGKKVEVPEFDATELSVLSKQLNNIGEIYSALRYKQAALVKTNTELSNANSFIKSNMSFLSHELINPTSSILEFSKMLQGRLKDLQDKDAKEYLDMICKASIHLNKQLSFFLRLFKFQAEKKKIEEKKINVKELLDWNISMVMHHIRDRDIKISVNVESNLYMMGDEMMIGQIVQNIASNGLKYNKEVGELKVCGKLNKKGQIEFWFIDTGIGMNKKDMQSTFKIFKRAKSAKGSKIIGYGIGLAYAKQCVDAHGAKIKLYSKVGVGTTFKVTFPKERHLV
ncbi:MAG: ATP-binding protein, partial [Alphaproteobacteria bacterium]